MKILSGAQVLVTRATGFLGKHVQAAVAEEGGETMPVSKSLGFDLRNQAQALEAVVYNTPDIVIHLCSARRSNDDSAGDLFRNEIQMGMNVIHAAMRSRAKMVLVSKAWGALSRENEAPFALGSMLRAYAAQYSLPWTWLVVPDLYGPGEAPNGNPARPVANILGTFAKSAKDGSKKAVLPGTGKEHLGLLFAADAARGIALAAASGLKGNIVQMPESEKLSAENLAKEVVAVSGYPGQVSWDDSKPGYPMATGLDGAEAEKLGWKPVTPLKDGLAATARWFVETQKAAK